MSTEKPEGSDMPTPTTSSVLVVFAILDAILLGRSMRSVVIPNLSADMPAWFLVSEVVRPLFLLSLAFSAYALASGRVWGFIVSYVQFPLRVAYALFSFGFLSMLPWLTIQGWSVQPVMVLALVLECGRLAWTIIIHVCVTRKTASPKAGASQ